MHGMKRSLEKRKEEVGVFRGGHGKMELGENLKREGKKMKRQWGSMIRRLERKKRARRSGKRKLEGFLNKNKKQEKKGMRKKQKSEKRSF